MFAKLALTALLGLLPLAGNAQFAGSPPPMANGFSGFNPNSFQSPFSTFPMGMPSTQFPNQGAGQGFSQAPNPYSQPFFGFPQSAMGQSPYGQPVSNGQFPSGFQTGMPFAQPTPYWMQTPPATNYMPPQPAAAPRPAPARAQVAPPTYYQYAPAPSAANARSRWAPLNGQLPTGTTNNWTGNSWSNLPEVQPTRAPATPPRWPTP